MSRYYTRYSVENELNYVGGEFKYYDDAISAIRSAIEHDKMREYGAIALYENVYEVEQEWDSLISHQQIFRF